MGYVVKVNTGELPAKLEQLPHGFEAQAETMEQSSMSLKLLSGVSPFEEAPSLSGGQHVTDSTIIIFDMDGTVLDSAPGILESLTYAIRQMGHDFIPGAETQKLFGPPNEPNCRRTFGAFRRRSSRRVRPPVPLPLQGARALQKLSVHRHQQCAQSFFGPSLLALYCDLETTRVC